MNSPVSKIGKKYSVGTKLIRKEYRSKWVIVHVGFDPENLEFYFGLLCPALLTDDINSTIEDVSLEFLETGFVIDEPMQRVGIDDFRREFNSEGFSDWFVHLANKSNHNTIVIVDHINGEYHITKTDND